MLAYCKNKQTLLNNSRALYLGRVADDNYFINVLLNTLQLHHVILS